MDGAAGRRGRGRSLVQGSPRRPEPEGEDADGRNPTADDAERHPHPRRPQAAGASHAVGHQQEAGQGEAGHEADGRQLAAQLRAVGQPHGGGRHGGQRENCRGRQRGRRGDEGAQHHHGADVRMLQAGRCRQNKSQQRAEPERQRHRRDQPDGGIATLLAGEQADGDQGQSQVHGGQRVQHAGIEIPHAGHRMGRGRRRPAQQQERQERHKREGRRAGGPRAHSSRPPSR